jgi:hypothetical protein
MRDIKDILNNIETIYGSNNALNTLKDFERVLDELDVYVYDNWIDGELAEGPVESRYWVTCTFMWPYKNMPDPQGGKRLLDFGCQLAFTQDEVTSVRKIKTPDDIRPGTKKGKVDTNKVWFVEIKIPKKLMFDINKGYKDLAKNKIATDEIKLDTSDMLAEPADQQLQQSMAGQ